MSVHPSIHRLILIYIWERNFFFERMLWVYRSRSIYCNNNNSASVTLKRHRHLFCAVCVWWDIVYIFCSEKVNYKFYKDSRNYDEEAYFDEVVECSQDKNNSKLFQVLNSWRICCCLRVYEFKVGNSWDFFFLSYLTKFISSRQYIYHWRDRAKSTHIYTNRNLLEPTNM